MVFSNIGSILNSLVVDPVSGLADDPTTIDRSLALRSHHVLLLSISSTVARLATGIIVDYISPVVVDESIVVGEDHGRRKRVVRRSMLAAGCLGVLAGAFLWGALGVKTVNALDGLSVGVGGMYGAVFTITYVGGADHLEAGGYLFAMLMRPGLGILFCRPAITSKHFGPGHFGLAWGMVSVRRKRSASIELQPLISCVFASSRVRRSLVVFRCGGSHLLFGESDLPAFCAYSHSLLSD